VLPLSSDYPVRGNSPVTWTIIALCCVVSFLQMIDTPPFSDATILQYGAQPALVVFDIFPPNPDSLRVAGSLVSSMFMHAGLWHLVGNMLFFHCFSMAIESLMGPWRYTLFYLLCGIAAALTYALMNQASAVPLVGASGAVAGVLAAHTILLPWTKINVSYYGSKSIPAWGFTAAWLGMQVLVMMDDSSNVAWQAHLGGIAAGLMLAPLFSKPGVLVMAPTPGTDEAIEHGDGFKVSTVPAAALAALLVVMLGGWMWSLQASPDRAARGEAGEWIALARLSGTGVPYDPPRGLVKFREAASDNAAVATDLARRLAAGTMGLPRDEAEAIKWYRSAAERGQPRAMEVYGLALVEGRNVPRAPQEGTAMLTRLSDGGYTAGDYWLGLIEELGLGGTTVDLASAARRYQHACDTTEWSSAKVSARERACFRLGLMRFKGRGGPANEPEGRRLIERASSNKLAEAMTAQALLLLTGDPEAREIGPAPGPEDARARYLLEQAVAAGNTDAAAALAAVKQRQGSKP
jgi:membrane associated rhomboid family serine protease/TPR repeat protein